MLAQAEKEAQGRYAGHLALKQLFLELEKKIAEKRAALSQRRSSLKPKIATVNENSWIYFF